MGSYNRPTGTLKKNKLIKFEKEIYNKSILNPTTVFFIQVVLSCSTINGRVYKRKTQFFLESEIITIMERLNDRRGNYYNNRDIWNAICRVERSKVSNRMRFSIYERDGYKCKNCGASGVYADLEIDHIIPISKGGKSTYNNLQTLCHRCNVEKGDKIPFKRK